MRKAGDSAEASTLDHNTEMPRIGLQGKVSGSQPQGAPQVVAGLSLGPETPDVKG
jgi:hypothetical protein